MDFSNYVKPELATLIPALCAIGMVLKHTQKLSDNFIPLVLTCISIFLCSLYEISVNGISGTSLFSAFVQGAFCAAGAVYAHQIYKQTKDSGKNDE